MIVIALLIVLHTISSVGLLANVTFRSRSSTLQFDEGSNFILDKKIHECQGSIIRNSGATISGQDIVFNGGILETEGNRFRLTGTFRATDQENIILNGNKTFRGIAGKAVQSITVSNKDNRIEGDLILDNALLLQDSNTTLTCALIRRFSQNINLNGGTIYLDEDLKLIEDKKIVSSGKVICNGRRFVLGSKESTWSSDIYFENANNIEMQARLNLESTWTFSGERNAIIGNGNILSLGTLGNIVVERGSSLTIKNVVIQDVSDAKIRCFDDTAKINFQDVIWIQSGDYTFEKGAFTIVGYMDMHGGNKFSLCTGLTSTISHGSALYLEPRFTFSYDPHNQANNLLYFADQTSMLYMIGSNLHTSRGGLALTSGKVVLDGSIRFAAESWNDPAYGIQLGDGLGDDCVLSILNSATLDLDLGHLVYKNIDPASLVTQSAFSILRINALGKFHIEQPFDMGSGRLFLHAHSELIRSSPEYLATNIEIFE